MNETSDTEIFKTLGFDVSKSEIEAFERFSLGYEEKGRWSRTDAEIATNFLNTVVAAWKRQAL